MDTHTHTHTHTHTRPLTQGIASNKYKSSSLSCNNLCYPDLSLEVIQPFSSNANSGCTSNTRGSCLTALDFSTLPSYTPNSPFFSISVSLDLILGNWDLCEAKEGKGWGLRPEKTGWGNDSSKLASGERVRKNASLERALLRCRPTKQLIFCHH